MLVFAPNQSHAIQEIVEQNRKFYLFIYLFYFILFYFILFYFIFYLLFYFILFYFILFYFILLIYSFLSKNNDKKEIFVEISRIVDHALQDKFALLRSMVKILFEKKKRKKRKKRKEKKRKEKKNYNNNKNKFSNIKIGQCCTPEPLVCSCGNVTDSCGQVRACPNTCGEDQQCVENACQ